MLLLMLKKNPYIEIDELGSLDDVAEMSNIQSLQKIAEAETAVKFPSPSLRMCITLHDHAPSAFYLKKIVSLFTVHIVFIFCIGFSISQDLTGKHEIEVFNPQQ